ncbi:uroporphyrinogen-III C-methyltransferase [Amylibacter kogurei]|uniref:Uroporphyrinogen-III C-methyltransferase n=1 Tax=Paramylibacter kogurei TaxID=1889778 RepID=A0A2G5K8F7_9RHOB|nr:siroheme synthase CysG [Amylibacter kogurei]PIB25160.1 uroporphyrinogen-III C-methyltransferase [Amylibacter kogurei]
MRHFPVFVDLSNKRVVVSGAGECAVAKLRLLLRTEADIHVFGADPVDVVRDWADGGKITLTPRALQNDDIAESVLFYAANDDAAEDARVAAIGRGISQLTNIVDNLDDSQFITPAIVDRDPVTVAIGTEGAAPVLARKIKQQVEESLPANLGILARIGQAFRPAADALPMGRKRRDFWSRFYFNAGPRALDRGGMVAAQETLNHLLDDALNTRAASGRVHLMGAGPGDPELLTLKARNLLHEADVVIHDQLVSAPILELARREAIVVETGKRGFGKSWKQDDINALMIKHAAQGHHVVRLKSGDPVIFGRLDEEMDALSNAGIPFDVIPGITSASAAAASIGQSLTKRGRNSTFRILTGHDVDGFADHDWRALARTGSTAAIYMGKRASRFLAGRLLMHGADSATPITIVENASRADQHILSTSLGALPDLMDQVALDGPAIILLGLAPRAALDAIDTLEEQEFA